MTARSYVDHAANVPFSRLIEDGRGRTGAAGGQVLLMVFQTPSSLYYNHTLWCKFRLERFLKWKPTLVAGLVIAEAELSVESASRNSPGLILPSYG